jgi:hypothetical protein
MGLARDTQIYKATYELTSKLMGWKGNFPRMFRYDLGEKLTKVTLELFEYIQLYNIAPFENRYKYILGFTVKYELLGTLLRLCFERKLFDERKQADICRLMTSIGRQATAMRKSSNPVAVNDRKREFRPATADGRSDSQLNNGPATVNPRQRL